MKDNALYAEENLRALARLLLRKWGWPEALDRARWLTQSSTNERGINFMRIMHLEGEASCA